MGAGECLVQLKLGAVFDDRLLVCDIMIQDLRQGQHLGLVVDDGQHIDGAGVLQLGILIELVENDLTVGVAAVFDDDTHTRTARLVAHIGNALDALFSVQIGNGLTQHALVDAVGDLGDDDASVFLVDLSLGTHHDATATGGVGLQNAVGAVNSGTGGEIGALDVFHQLGDGAFGVIHTEDGGVNDLAQVMGRDVGGHTDGDTDGTVDQKIGKTGGQYGRLVQTVIKVLGHLDHVFVHITKQFVRDLGHSRLGVTVSGRAVAVDRAKVTLSFYQGIAVGEVLRHTHHGAVDGAVTVGVIAAQHVTDGGSRLTEGLVMDQAILVHGVHDTALARLHAVAHVGQGAGDDDRHGVFDEGFFDLLLHGDGDDLLVGEFDAFVFVFFIKGFQWSRVLSLILYGGGLIFLVTA